MGQHSSPKGPAAGLLTSRCLQMLLKEETWTCPNFLFETLNFKHLTCFLCSIVNKILVYEVWKTLHFVFIYFLYGVPTFLGDWGCSNGSKRWLQMSFQIVWTEKMNPSSNCIWQPSRLGSKPAAAGILLDPRKCAAAVHGCGFFYWARPTTAISMTQMTRRGRPELRWLVFGCVCVMCEVETRVTARKQPPVSALNHSNDTWETPCVAQIFTTGCKFAFRSQMHNRQRKDNKTSMSVQSKGININQHWMMLMLTWKGGSDVILRGF